MNVNIGPSERLVVEVGETVCIVREEEIDPSLLENTELSKWMNPG